MQPCCIGDHTLFDRKSPISLRADHPARLAPMPAVMQGPIDQGGFETDVVSDFFAFQPFVPQDFVALGEKLLIKR
jgi:hypothetical protein